VLNKVESLSLSILFALKLKTVDHPVKIGALIELLHTLTFDKLNYTLWQKQVKASNSLEQLVMHLQF